MSSYQRDTFHPETEVIEKAEWLDNYFGSHQYGVRFPSDGNVYQADQFDIETHTDFDAVRLLPRVPELTVMKTNKGSYFEHPLHIVDKADDGKITTTVKHEDGRQDVKIEVTRLDLKDPTPEDEASAKLIEDAMSKKIVTVVVIHKPTNQSVVFPSPLPLVRKRAEEVVFAHHDKRVNLEGAFHESPKDYCIVEFDAGQVRVTSL